MTRLSLILLSALGVAACGSGDSSSSASADSTAADTSAAAPSRLTLTPEQVKNAEIEVGPAEERPVTDLLEATAEIEASPTGFAQIGARVAGRITRLLAAEGDRVAQGQSLAAIDSPELGQFTGDYLAAVTLADVAREIADRERQLFDRRISSEREWRLAEAEAVRARATKESAENRLHALGLSDGDLRQLQVARHFSSEVTVRSPIAGIVASRAASIGKIVQPGEGLFEVVDLREVAIAIDVYEQALGRVRAGQRVEVKTTTTGDQIFTGRVSSVGGVVEKATRTVKVRVLLPNPGGVLRPGMFATVRVVGAVLGTRPGIYVPSGAVQRDGPATIVFVKMAAPANTFERREVEVGAEVGGWMLVLTGLAAGEVVATRGSLALKSEFRKGTLGEPE